MFPPYPHLFPTPRVGLTFAAILGTLKPTSGAPAPQNSEKMNRKGRRQDDRYVGDFIIVDPCGHLRPRIYH
ncbi:protein of unknown function [Kyrpidia spormannii]|uniref:Uncharacterized protein n=1 Tax=Kyrpidia spormannii TaxID=2055160 RepID=A0ACA8Z7B7_9BACL|nr:protein of unknown function [Kyrpidia spormannii]